MLAGSASRGCADRYSDIEMGVFWDGPPSDEERMAHIEPAGGMFWELDPYDEVEKIWLTTLTNWDGRWCESIRCFTTGAGG